MALGDDATAYGGKEAGFDPSYSSNTGEYSGSPGPDDYASDFLSGMYSGDTPYENSFDNIDTSTNSAMAEGEGFFDNGFGKKVKNFFTVNPESKAYGWGLRTPGSAEARNFFGTETGGERDSRMGNVSSAIDSLTGMMPGVGMARGINSVYKGYNAGQPLSTLAGNFMSGMGGVPGALGSALQGKYGQAVSRAFPGAGGVAAGLATDASMGKDVTNPAMSFAGGMLGNQMGGPVGGFLGSKAGGALAESMQPKPQGQAMANNPNPWTAQNTGYSPQQTAQPQSQGAGGISDMFGGAGNTIGQLMGLYNNYQQGEAANKAASQMQANIPDLNSMFGPNSAAYGRVKQELDRKDAAAGRRSQYGNRAVDLEARMAQMMGQYAPGIANANNAAQQATLRAQQEGGTRQAQMLNNLFQIGKNTGANKWLGDQFQGGLSSLFGNNAQEQQPTTPEVFDPYANYRTNGWT